MAGINVIRIQGHTVINGERIRVDLSAPPDGRLDSSTYAGLVKRLTQGSILPGFFTVETDEGGSITIFDDQADRKGRSEALKNWLG